jgi:hypothetical protein
MYVQFLPLVDIVIDLIILSFIPEKLWLYLGSLAEVSVHPPTLHFGH